MIISISIKERDEEAIQAILDIKKLINKDGTSISMYIRNLIVKDVKNGYKSRNKSKG